MPVYRSGLLTKDHYRSQQKVFDQDPACRCCRLTEEPNRFRDIMRKLIAVESSGAKMACAR
jgi:hypothetical protein